MARLEDMPKEQAAHIANLDCPTYVTQPWVAGPPLSQRRVALISTAGLHHRQDRPHTGLTPDYRVIPGDIAPQDLVMSHVSTNFDRTGFIQDFNLIFPLERLRELADQGLIAGVADFHYSFMGATDPRQMSGQAGEVARLLLKDQVNAVLLVPV
ncbi:MAG: selenoprotein B glycine/betaine/sarcosine/D-proline reductase [Deltaproteobacteria bacterium]|nr:selenoprotein B glycine/betaine/sarcosine/D-proline reductase [Deltaproteobacteria bacterium]